MFLSAVTLKIRSRSQSPNQGFWMSKCCIHANCGQYQVISSGDIEHNTHFWSKFSIFLSAVTLKIRPRSQNPYQGLGMSKCCILANFGQNALNRSGYIVHILKGHANISADTDADADGSCIKVYASHSNLFVGFMNRHKV